MSNVPPISIKAMYLVQYICDKSEDAICLGSGADQADKSLMAKLLTKALEAYEQDIQG